MNGSPRFWQRVSNIGSDGCWEWQGYARKGYGRFHAKRGRKVMAHRYAYEAMVGPIPDGLHMDHLCRNRRCVNPAHLDVVTNEENRRRGLLGSARTHCARGHSLTPDNVVPWAKGPRQCLACHKANRRRYQAAWRKRKAA